MNDYFKAIVDSTALKSVLASIVLAVGGMGVKQIVHQDEIDHTVEWHAKAIQQLQVSQETTNLAIQSHTITLSQINGKLDVINQKIDDDRNYAQRHQVVNTR